MIPALGFQMQNYGKKQHEKFYEEKKWICGVCQIHKYTDYQ